jgi:activator of 2-hydroxyglutaryl-CoA dehydratase
MPKAPPASGAQEVVLGIDVGSTGSKAVALDAARGEPAWEGYVRTSGNPVGAAQELVRAFLAHPAAAATVRCVGVTGSGREIVGSLLATCYGTKAVFVLNEIAAHARGATTTTRGWTRSSRSADRTQKYIRLAGGRVIDAAMNGRAAPAPDRSSRSRAPVLRRGGRRRPQGDRHGGGPQPRSASTARCSRRR